MAIDANALFEESKCYTCLGISIPNALTLALERRWLLSLDPGADTSVSAMLNSVKCEACQGQTVFDLLETAFLSQIGDSL